MPKGYWIARVDVTNEAAYAKYRELNPAAFERFGGTFIARGPAGKVAMGSPRKHNVVLEFPSYEAALACYDSPEYTKARMHLAEAGEVDLVIMPGNDA